MKYTQYISLIEKLETLAAENPQKYEWRVAALGALGYVYFIGIVAAFLAIPLAIIVLIWFFPVLFWVLVKAALKLIWFIIIGIAAVLGFLVSTLRSLWTKIPEPEGIELSRESAPEIFALADKMSVSLNASFPDKILLTEDYNAAVMTLPRFGMFGKKVFLLAGLPLMQAISPAQFEAVVAHEFGHISRRHGRFSAWIYRLHETWDVFLKSQEQHEHKFSFLYKKFVNWYFPYFSAYSFVLMRRHEREADQDAARLIGAQQLGEALINTEVKGINLAQNFWRKILEQAEYQTKPPEKVFSQMAMSFREENGSYDVVNLAKAVAVRTDYRDSHPALGERLKLIGYWNAEKNDLPDLPAPVSRNAAEVYLGDTAQKFADSFDAAWQSRVESDWRLRHKHLAEVQKRIAELESKTETLSADEMYELAMLRAEKFGAQESIALLRETVEKYPENGSANFSLGAVLLDDDREEGIAFLEKAKQLEISLKAPADEAIFEYLRRKGRDKEAEIYLEAIEKQYETIDSARQERAGFAPTDGYLQDVLPPENLEKVLKTLSYHEEIKAAYLVRKSVEHLPEIPFHVLCLDVKVPRFKFGGVSSENVLEAVANQVGKFGIDYIVLLEKSYSSLKKDLQRNDAVKIY
jgi:Zn-dependent protease with chaperone function